MAPVYATPQEYADWLHPESAPGAEDPPAGAERALRAASARVRKLTRTACYETDENGLPTDSDVLAAFRDATCAQADYSKAIKDQYSRGTAGQWGSLKLGSASMTRGQSPGGVTEKPSPYSWEAYEILQEAGVVPAGPLRIG
ncbi:hypothetical protein GCM10027447_12440 [Glycomyces halotolerans]